MKKFYLNIVFLCFCTSLIYPQTDWTKHADNPVLSPGVSGSWDETSATVNTVLFHENIYKMWYEGDDGFGYATSPDGINWIKDSLNNPVLEPGPAGAWDEMEINNASVLVKDNIYHMWYSGIDFIHDNRIGYATSLDGINWSKDSLNPVIDHGNPGSWDDEEVMHPFVIYKNDTLKMYYNGHDGITQRILYATSIDGKNWDRFTQHPILEPGAGGAWDSDELGPLSVLYFNNSYHMWYTGWNFADYIQIGHATSPNGIDWSKDSVVLGHGDPGEWDDGAVALPYVIVDVEDSLYKMWYGGTDGIIFQTGYATSDLIVSVEKIENVLPSQFVLLQNFPNPFNPATKIRYQIIKAGFVSIKVYDVLGNEVVTLVNEELPAGEYEVEFSSHSGEVRNLTSGIYFYRIQAVPTGRQAVDPESSSGQVYIETKKMILIK
jgi:predicted GH43/DUF377 family glycosyl hydrolase